MNIMQCLCCRLHFNQVDLAPGSLRCEVIKCPRKSWRMLSNIPTAVQSPETQSASDRDQCACLFCGARHAPVVCYARVLNRTYEDITVVSIGIEIGSKKLTPVA